MSSSSQRSSTPLMIFASAAAYTQQSQSHMKGKGVKVIPYTSQERLWCTCQKCSSRYFIRFPFSFFLFCISRYSAVCNPYKYREKNMENMKSSFAKVLSLIISASVAINIPRFFETAIVNENFSSESEKRDNLSYNFPLDFEDFSYKFEVTPLRPDPNYIR